MKQMTGNSVGERIKNMRFPLSQREFAQSLGIPQTTLSNYELDKNEPNIQTINKMCTLCGVSADWLLFGITPPAKSSDDSASQRLVRALYDNIELTKRIGELELENLRLKNGLVNI